MKTKKEIQEAKEYKESKQLTEDEYKLKFKTTNGYALYYANQNKDIPVYNAYGLEKVKGGYRVHTMAMIGKKPQSHKYTEVEPKNFALNKLLSKIRADLNED